MKFILTVFFISVSLCILYLYLFCLYNSITSPNIFWLGDTNNEIGTKIELHGHVHVYNEESGKAMAVANCIYLASVIFLIVMLLYRFYFNKKKSTVYV